MCVASVHASTSEYNIFARDDVMPHKSTATACSAAAKSMRKKKAHSGSQWKKGGMKKDGTPGKAGMWGARRLAIGCRGKGKGKK